MTQTVFMSIVILNKLVQEATRVTPTSSTLIDLIFTNMPDKHTATGVVNLSISDHYLTYTSVSFKCPKAPPSIIRCRNLNSLNVDRFRYDILCSDINKVCNIENASRAWDEWKRIFLLICNKHAPLRDIRVKSRCNPWISKEIILLINQREHLHRKQLKTRDPEDISAYRKIRNFITYKIRITKKEYYNRNISENKSNSSKLWGTLKHLLNSKKDSSPIPQDLSAENFNNFFTTIGKNLSKTVKSYNQGSFNCTTETPFKFKFDLVESSLIYRYLKMLSCKTTLDPLNMCDFFLKISANLIANSLTHIYNLTLSTSDIPADFKVARVTPVYKRKGSKSDINNYRPISVIPTLAKILEFIVKSQLENYCSTFSILSPFQHAYQKHKSTVTALHQITDDILKEMDKGFVTACVFLDLTKGFDILPHDLLLKKMKNLGIQSTELNWFQNYLSDRKQFVKCNNQISNVSSINIGVPQGTILGPSLFLLYVNDLTSHINNNCKAVLYADDTSLYCHGHTAADATSRLQNALNSVMTWFDENKLIISSNKSKYMLFGHPSRIPINCFPIMANNSAVEHCNEFKLLGMVLDSSLSWSKHIQHLSKQISAKLGVLMRLSRILDSETLHILFLSLVQPHLDYGITLFGHKMSYNNNWLQRLQNRAARIVTKNYDYENNSGINIVNDLQWMTVAKRFNYFTGILMFKALHSLLPQSMCGQFLQLREFHKYNTRNALSDCITLPKPRTNYLKYSLAYHGAYYWNSVPLQLRRIDSLHEFKSQFKTYLLQN